MCCRRGGRHRVPGSRGPGPRDKGWRDWVTLISCSRWPIGGPAQAPGRAATPCSLPQPPAPSLGTRPASRHRGICAVALGKGPGVSPQARANHALHRGHGPGSPGAEGGGAPRPGQVGHGHRHLGAQTGSSSNTDMEWPAQHRPWDQPRSSRPEPWTWLGCPSSTPRGTGWHVAPGTHGPGAGWLLRLLRLGLLLPPAPPSACPGLATTCSRGGRHWTPWFPAPSSSCRSQNCPCSVWRGWDPGQRQGSDTW